jgi:hypothetical protein
MRYVAEIRQHFGPSVMRYVATRTVLKKDEAAGRHRLRIPASSISLSHIIMSNANSSDSETPNHGVEPLRKGPIRCDNCSKTAKDAGRSKLSICSACSSAPYCSGEYLPFPCVRH